MATATGSMPVVDEDDDWLSQVLTQDATKPVAPAPASAWNDKDSPQSQLRRELAAELAPDPPAPLSRTLTEAEPSPADLSEPFPAADLVSEEPPLDGEAVALERDDSQEGLDPSSTAPVPDDGKETTPAEEVEPILAGTDVGLEVPPTVAEEEPTLEAVSSVPEEPPAEPPPINVDEIVSSVAPVEDEQALSADEIQSLMSNFDEEDIPDPQPNLPAPAEPAAVAEGESDPRASCPSGQPKPKINLAAMKKVKPQSAEQVARLFGGEAPPEDASKGKEDSDDELSTRTSSMYEEPVLVERPLPKVLVLLDQATQRLTKVHSKLPLVAGIAGVACLGHGVLILLLASLGWI